MLSYKCLICTVFCSSFASFFCSSYVLSSFFRLLRRNDDEKFYFIFLLFSSTKRKNQRWLTIIRFTFFFLFKTDSCFLFFLFFSPWRSLHAHKSTEYLSSRFMVEGCVNPLRFFRCFSRAFRSLLNFNKIKRRDRIVCRSKLLSLLS